MRVVLAGYNVDARVLAQAVADGGIRAEQLTPEVLSAAYARISRDPRPIGELRRVALEELETARASNRRIIFEMGHHSVAEHAVFNFDIMGISRLAIEWLERFRLCSYTEKSQRYITLDHDFVIPPELENTPYESALLSLITAQSKCYDHINQCLREHLKKKYPDMEKKRRGRRLLDGWAKEDARYVTLLATTGQLGLTANARNLELMVRRFAAAPLSEVQNLGISLYNTAAEIAPSLLLFTEASPYDAQRAEELGALADELLKGEPASNGGEPEVRLVHCSENADRTIAAALLHVFSSESFDTCLRAALNMPEEALTRVFQTAMGRMEFYDAVPREFEHVSLTFEIALSSSAFAQLKRHRMTTQSAQAYDPNLGVTIPPAIDEIGLRGVFMDHLARAEDLFVTLKKTMPHVAPYVLTNAHRRRVLATINLRELYHFVRLREDAHAQWDIRELATKMRCAAKSAIPLGACLLCGKDRYVDQYREVFGRAPSVVPPAE
ncbi:MAG: FAD-dependent thymidylate synthase [Myxococcota bacterium]|nr:FAD-dependent thymidylate synthase [Myxococcota bacterium]